MSEPARIPLWLAPDNGGTTIPVVVVPQYAGFWRRFVAALVDLVIVNAIFWTLMVILFAGKSNADEEPVAGLGDVLAGLAILLAFRALIEWLYVATLECSSWQATIGKRAFRMVVTDLAGDRISFGRATGRYFAKYLSSFLLIGYLVQPFTAKRQALHDAIARTVVVRT